MLNPLDDPRRLLIPGEVALILRVSRTQIYRLLQTELPAIRFGGSTVRVLSGDLWKCIDDHKNLNDQNDDQHEQKKAPNLVCVGGRRSTSRVILKIWCDLILTLPGGKARAIDQKIKRSISTIKQNRNY